MVELNEREAGLEDDVTDLPAPVELVLDVPLPKPAAAKIFRIFEDFGVPGKWPVQEGIDATVMQDIAISCVMNLGRYSPDVSDIDTAPRHRWVLGSAGPWVCRG